MAELRPAPFRDLVARLFLEPARQSTLFELPRNRWHLPAPDGPSTRVLFHGRPAANPLGPAAGPHTQMAQNLLLSYAAGSRILELKTVQVNDRLTIPRPCIDMTNVGYNVEWSQELLVEESAREYAAGWMLIHMFRNAHHALTNQSIAPANSDSVWAGPTGDFLFDLSVGYDLAGIRSDKVRRFLDTMRDASALIEPLRGEIPGAFVPARELNFPARLSDSITLSTFHGCPADEIERICEFLIGDCDFNVIVKMNPPMLGKARLEHLLHDVLGYTELTVNPSAYSSGLSFDEGVQLCQRLTRYATTHGRSFGAKFSNTLEVLNHRNFFTPDNKVMYLSGQPLHVITITLADEFRRAMGPAFPISFSAGIDQQNFPAAVACGFVPITISTDLLRPGGYGRLPAYLQRLSIEMKKVAAANLDDYVLRARSGPEGVSAVPEAAARNLAIIAEEARNDPRYRAENNRKVPHRLNRHLVTFDCITCDKCLPVCPNAANFTYPTPRVAFDYNDLMVTPIGNGFTTRLGDHRTFEINETMQIACYADFCNECGNCDTFCPEYGGPYIKKPTFFGSEASWRAASPRDGFVVGRTDGRACIRGRIHGQVYVLSIQEGDGIAFDDGTVELKADSAADVPRVVRAVKPLAGEHRVDLWVYHTMRHLLCGVLDEQRINQVNAANA